MTSFSLSAHRVTDFILFLAGAVICLAEAAFSSVLKFQGMFEAPPTEAEVSQWGYSPESSSGPQQNVCKLTFSCCEPRKQSRAWMNINRIAAVAQYTSSKLSRLNLRQGGIYVKASGEKCCGGLETCSTSLQSL